MLKRTIFEPEHEDFRTSIKRFFENECLPHRERWEAQGHVDRAMWNRAGELGLLCMNIPEEYGGGWRRPALHGDLDGRARLFRRPMR